MMMDNYISKEILPIIEELILELATKQPYNPVNLFLSYRSK